MPLLFYTTFFEFFEWFDFAKVITNYIFRAVNLHLFANDKFKPPIWNNEIYAVANYVFRPAIPLAHGQKVCYQIFILCSYHSRDPFFHIYGSTVDNCEWNFDSIVFWSDKKPTLIWISKTEMSNKTRQMLALRLTQMFLVNFPNWTYLNTIWILSK